MIQDIDHIAIVVRSIEQSLPFYTGILGFYLERTEEVPHMLVRVAMLASSAGTTRIELVEPTVSDTGITRFLEKRGEGVHHLCFTVEDLRAELERLKSVGVRLIDEFPRQGVGGSEVAFIHPLSCNGLLIELKQK